MEPGDFDGDVDIDIASANSGFPDDQVAVVLNDGMGRFGSRIDTVVPDYPLDVSGADFDGDGDIDLAANVNVFVTADTGEFIATS